MKRREELSTPRRSRRLSVHYDPEAFGQFSEGIARTIGTARFLVWQTIIVIIWILINIVIRPWRFDEYPFILLTLALSLQAAYAAPLILLAQNRQEARDRAQSQLDRASGERALADTEFLAREIASVRLALSDVVTTEDLRENLSDVTNELRQLLEKLDGLPAAEAD